MTRLTIDELEILTPDELWELLILEVRKDLMDIQFIQDLITCGCPIDVKDAHGFTALHVVAWKGHLEVVKLLISNGAQVDAKNIADRTALYWAVRNGDGDIEVVKFLISKGAQVDVRDIDGKTPWDVANEETREAIPELEPHE